MKYCHSCDEQIQENSSFCRQCGARVDADNIFTSPTDASQSASKSFGDSFGDPSQRFGDPSKNFADQKQSDIAGTQNRETQLSSQDVFQHHETPNAQHNAQDNALQNATYNVPQNTPQNNQHVQHPRQFEPYAQQQRMYQQYQQYRQQADDTLQILPEHEQFKKLGGWMLVIVLCMTAAIFVNLITTVRHLNEIAWIWQRAHLLPDNLYTAIMLEIAGGAIMLFVVILQIVFVTSVVQRKPRFMLVEQMMYIIITIAQICFVVSAFTADTFIPGSVGFELVARPFAAIIAMIIMTAYYSRSVRVRVYMRSDDYKSKALLKFRRSPMWPY